MPRKTTHRQMESFLLHLERTGNFALAADHCRLAKSGLYKRRARDPLFAGRCTAAVASFRIAASKGSAHPEEGPEGLSRRALKPLLTTPGSVHLGRYAGQVQLRRLPAGCLAEAGVDAFLAILAATCNVRLAADRVGVAPSSIYARRRSDAAFAEAMDQAIATAAFNLECALLEKAERSFSDDWFDDGGPENSAHPELVEGPPMTVEEALQLLILHRNAFGTPRTRHDRRQAAHAARYRPRLSDEEVRAQLVKSLMAFGKRIANGEQ